MNTVSKHLAKARAARGKKRVKKAKASTEPKPEAVQESKPTPEDKNILFPDRQVVYSGEEYVPPDQTVLMRNGKRWIPEEHGYRARICSPETVEKLGMGPYTIVPPEAGISFIDHPLNAKSTKKDGHFGTGVYLGNSCLCLCPLEESMKRRQFAKNQSDSMLQTQRENADEEAYKHDPGQKGTYRTGRTMDRGYVDSKRKIIVSVPDQIR